MTAATPARPPPRVDLRWLGEIVALAAVYFLTARLGLLTAISGGHVTPVWPPSGIALAAVLLRGRRVWPGIWLGSFAANIWDFYGGPLSLATELATAATFGIAASLAALSGWLLLRRFVGARNPLERVQDVCAFMALGGVVSCLGSATIGVTTLCLVGYAPWSSYGETWLTWWLGDTGGVFIVAPLLLVWAGTHRRMLAARWVELFGGFGLMIAITYYVFCQNTAVAFTGKPLTFIILIPFLVWAAVRTGRRGAAAAVGLTALLAVWGTIHQTGPFNLGPRNEALLLLELFLGVMALTALCLAAMVTEREQVAAEQQRAVEKLELHVLERTSALVQSEAQARQHLAEAERARTALLSILEDQHQVEEKLRESETRFRELAENIHEVFWVWTATGRPQLLYVSPAYATIWGRSCESLYGSPESWKEALHPDDKGWVLAEIAGLDLEKVNDLTYRIVRPDQSIRWIRDRIFPVRDRSGVVVRFAGIAEDITESKTIAKALESAEEQYHSIFNNAVNGIFRTSPGGKLLVTNPAAARIFGFASPEEAIEARWDIANQGYVDPRRREELKRLLQEQGAVQGFEFEAYRKDGSRVWISENTRAVRSPSGEILYFEGIFEDVTDRKRAEEAFSAQALRYKTLMETSPDSIYVLDEEGNLREANAAFLRQRGYTPSEGKNLNFADWDAQWSREELQKRLLTMAEKSSVFETRHRSKDGSVFDVEVSATSVLIGGEQLFFCVTRDITERKQAEEQLRRSEEKFKALFDLAPVGIAVLDRQRNVLDANSALAQITRLSRKELLTGGQLARTVLKADGTPMPPHEFPSARALRANRPISNIETGIVLENGEAVWLQVSAAPLALPDMSVVVVTQDITERKCAEEELKREKEVLAKIVNNIPVMIGFVGTDGSVKLVNPEWERTIGWTLKELRDQNVDIFKEAYPDLSYRQEVLDFVAAATGEWADLKIKVRDGRVIDVACAVVHLSDGTKVAIAQDVTDRKQAAEKLEEANRQLRILSRQLFHIQEEERRHLARELHDEIGQTLTAAKINLTILAPDAPAKIGGRLSDSIELLDRLLKQVRQLSLDLRPPLLDELGLVPTLRWLVDQQTQRAGLRASFTANVDGLEIDPDIQTTCFRIAQEALTNIIRHSGASNVAVKVWCAAKRLSLSVRDDGAGFDPSAIQQGVSHHSSLGLVSMKERTLLVRGGLEVHSAPGQGTEIRAWFPLAPGKHSSPAEIA